MMASQLFSKLSHLKRHLPKVQLVSQARRLTAADFMFHGAVHPAAFCYVPYVAHRQSGMPFAHVIETKNGEVGANARSVSSLINHERVINVRLFPREILESESKLFELFEIWMAENDRTYPSDKEKMRRFEGFKDYVLSVHEDNSRTKSWCSSVNSLADSLPSDPYAGALMTEEESIIACWIMDAESDLEA